MSSEQRTENRGQGTGNREQGTGSGERGAGSSERGAGSGGQGVVGANCNSPFSFRGNSNSSLKE